MGIDVPATIRHFGRQGRLFFAHFRNLRGLANDFCEMFHDDGDTDMFAAMRAYDIGFEAPCAPITCPRSRATPTPAPATACGGGLSSAT